MYAPRSSYTPKAGAGTIVVRANAVARPDAQVVAIVVFAAAAQRAIVDALVDVARPLPHVTRHVILAIWAARIQRGIARVGLAVVEPNRSRVALLARPYLSGIMASIIVSVVRCKL